MTKRKTRPAGASGEEGARYTPEDIELPEKSLRTTKLFKNGRSQPVRLPKDFRFEGDEVHVKRVQGGVVLLSRDAPNYARLRVDLERAGMGIGSPDLPIAAQAVAHGATLVTNNLREFRRVPGLRVENWLA